MMTENVQRELVAGEPRWWQETEDSCANLGFNCTNYVDERLKLKVMRVIAIADFDFL